ncbi:MAG: DEAD/DEAH box helicase [Oligoflexia bacterium]|nr:DEAD/DEAH box helicase [Oligoflexia bacterium]
MQFSEFELRPEILSQLEEMGFKEPTPIQTAVIPTILKGKDVSGLAQTGTGKTGAFVIPLLDRWLKAKEDSQAWKKNSYYLILVPTRELAAQVDKAVKELGAKTDVKTACIYGGAGYDEQKKALKDNPTFVVGTPGRLLDLYKTHDLDLNAVKAIVFDEADRMFDMGFKDDMKYILRRVPRERQFLLFSATLNFDVINTAYQFGAEPVEYNISRDQATAEGVEHEILHVGDNEKPMYLLSILKKHAPLQCIVFSNFKNNVGRIAKFLKINGVEATAMSSLLSQMQRNKVLEAFKTGKKTILVATDVAARGLDIKGVDLVINFELPDDSEGYVHRIGRTGRAGTKGKAVGLVSDKDVDALQRIEIYLKEKINTGWFEDAELIKEFKPFPAYDDFRFEKPEHKPHRQKSEHHHHQKRDAHGGGGRHQHRDRHSGRHSNPYKDQRPKHPQNAQKQGHYKQSQSHQHKQLKQNNQQHFKRRPLKPVTSLAQQTPNTQAVGIAGKIKNFLTKLFS